MSDAGSNFSTVGHRRWLIYPNLQSVGFGYAQDGSVAYSATYVIEGAPRGGEEPDLAWPPRKCRWNSLRTRTRGASTSAAATTTRGAPRSG